MENKSHAFWAGLFTIVLLVAIALTIAWFSMDRTERVPYDLVATTNVTGLRADAAVRYRGLAVGKVQNIHFDTHRPGRIVIRILVDKRVPLTHSSFASLGFQGVTGLGFIQLDDTGDDPHPVTSSDENVAQIPMRPGVFDDLQRRGVALLNQMEKIAVNLQQMTDEPKRQQYWATARSIQDAASGVAALTQHLEPVTRKLPNTIDELNRTMGSVNVLATSLSNPNGSVAVNLNRMGQAAEQAGVALAQLNTSMQELSARVGYETLPRVNALTDGVKQAMRSVNSAAGAINANPRALLFGAPPPEPGPGEPGFSWSSSSSR
ncbi:MCE family protein [Mycetohabitans sp. B8]|uniref:MlaD family protein n=1 Tax=Mycetohabitans sp. B8 TaxID=2841845 RepID=UPI001F1AFA7D|nr:MlaD family protein [Mycetohabitans sp. B8]MCG1043489.1 MCE family protein [Mycetohabitans sp. B8]